MNRLISKKKILTVTLSLILPFLASAVVEFDQNVTPNVIYGSGNANGFFTTDRNTVAKVEVGLRAKIPFVGTTNSNGDGTYSFTLLETDHDGNPGTANRWNFDFAINVDYLDNTSSGAKLDDFTYELGLDSDPSGDTEFLAGDPIAANGFFAPDHSMGDNTTANGGGSEAPIFPISTYNGMLSSNNVIQNSQGYSTYSGAFSDGYDASIPGTYDIYLIVKLAGIEVARSDIQVIIGGGGAPANTPPITVADSYLVDEDNMLSVANPNGVLSNDSDNDNDPLVVSNPGVIAANTQSSGNITLFADGTFTYTPPNDFNGDATFDYLVSDGALTTASSVTVTVNAINDIPSFIKGSDEIVDEDAGAQTVSLWATDIATGPANESAQTLSFNISNDNNALFNVQPSVSASGDLTYTAADDVNGTATVTVSVTDNGGGTDTTADQTFMITVNAINDIPETTEDLYSVNEDASLIIVNPNGVLANDSDVDGDTMTIVETGSISSTNANAGSIIMAADGTFTYNPPYDFNGSATFEFTVTDSVIVNSIASSLTITVNSVNDPPSFNLFCDIDATDVTGSTSITVQIPDFVYDMLVGPTNELSQTFSLAVAIVSAGDPDSIVANLSIDNAGAISIDFNLSNSGVATLEVTMQDDGNTDFGGVDATVIQFNVHHYADLELDPNYSGLAIGDILYKNTFDACR